MRQLLAFITATSSLASPFGARGVAQPREPATPVHETQFLVDEGLVDRTAGVRRVLGEPMKDPEPLMSAAAPWEDDGRGLLSVVFDREENKFKLWYRAYFPAERLLKPGTQVTEPSERPSAAKREFLCYAESRDGRDWRRPDVGIFEFQGSTHNNILMDVTVQGSSFLTVVKDPLDPDPSRRYKAMGFARTSKSVLLDKPSGGFGLTVTFSADGVHWPKEPILVMDTSDVTDSDTFLPDRDPASGKWIGYFRPRTKPKRRFIGYSESDDFEHWTYPRMLLTPDAGDSEFLEFYGMTISAIGGYRLGAVWTFYNDPAWSTMGSELVYSLDGLHYRRAMPGHAWIPAGRQGSFDSVMLVPRTLVDRGDEIWIYYDGSNSTHGSDRVPGSKMTKSVTRNGEPRRTEIGLARLPWGHFAGYRADDAGMVETRWLTNYGADAAVKAVAAMDVTGSIQAEILDQYGNVIPGWTRKESRHRVDPSDHNKLVFSWGSDDLVGRSGQRSPAGGMVGHVVKLRFHLRQATLYGFQLEHGPTTPAFPK